MFSLYVPTPTLTPLGFLVIKKMVFELLRNKNAGTVRTICPLNRGMFCDLKKNKWEKNHRKKKRGGGLRKILALRPSLTVQTNYPDSLGPGALQHTLITREPRGAIIKAEPNERRGWSYRDTIRPRTSSRWHQRRGVDLGAMLPGLLGSQWGRRPVGTWA